MTPVPLAPADELRARLDDLDRRLCDAVVERTRLARQLAAGRRDFPHELRALARYSQRLGADGLTLALLLIRRGSGRPSAAALTGPGLAARVTVRVGDPTDAGVDAPGVVP
jgi:hypothetical protein